MSYRIAGKHMAEKESAKLDSSGRSSKSRGKSVKVVHIGNPKMVQASESEFRTVVQSLTGQKRPLSTSASYDAQSSSTSKGMNWDWDESPQVKVPKLEGPLKCCPIPNSTPQPAIDTDGVSTSEVQQKETTSDIYAQQIFDTLENLGDAILYFRFAPHIASI